MLARAHSGFRKNRTQKFDYGPLKIAAPFSKTFCGLVFALVYFSIISFRVIVTLNWALETLATTIIDIFRLVLSYNYQAPCVSIGMAGRYTHKVDDTAVSNSLMDY